MVRLPAKLEVTDCFLAKMYEPRAQNWQRYSTGSSSSRTYCRSRRSGRSGTGNWSVRSGGREERGVGSGSGSSGRTSSSSSTKVVVVVVVVVVSVM